MWSWKAREKNLLCRNNFHSKPHTAARLRSTKSFQWVEKHIYLMWEKRSFASISTARFFPNFFVCLFVRRRWRESLMSRFQNRERWFRIPVNLSVFQHFLKSVFSWKNLKRFLALEQRDCPFLFVCFVTFCEFVEFSSCQKTISRKSYTVIKVNKPLRTW